MSRFKIILLLVLGIGLVVGLFLLQYFTSVRSVKFDVKDPIAGKLYKVVDNKKEQLTQTINTSSVIMLQSGDYCVEPTDSKYNKNPICFTVGNKDISVTIEPNYSKEYLEELLPNEINSINTLIQEKYKEVIDGFVLKQGALLGHGEWYGGTFTQRVARSDQGDVYRFLLKKTDGTWSVIAYPQIVLTTFDYPSVPFNILDSINRYAGIQGSL